MTPANHKRSELAADGHRFRRSAFALAIVTVLLLATTAPSHWLEGPLPNPSNPSLALGDWADPWGPAKRAARLSLPNPRVIRMPLWTVYFKPPHMEPASPDSRTTESLGIEIDPLEISPVEGEQVEPIDSSQGEP